MSASIAVYFRPYAPPDRCWEVVGGGPTLMFGNLADATTAAQTRRGVQPSEPGPGRRVRHG
jgi:hypothetical protein